MANSREGSSIIDVVNQIHIDADKSISTPLVKQLVRSTVRRWKEKHECAINKRIEKVKLDRKKRRLEEMASTFPENRKLSLDVLAREWLEENPGTLDARIYLIEKLLPCLIMGLEKLLTEVEKRDLVDGETAASFNPVNYLAQYLMRNNPIYSNFPEASPYAKGLRKVAEDLKKDLFSMETNNLAKLKEEAQLKRLERGKKEWMNKEEQSRRAILFENLFVDWIQDEGTLSLAVVQNALASFLTYSELLPKEIERDAYFAMKIPEIDKTGRMLTVHEFKEVLGEYAINLSNVVFEKFMEHLTRCAHDYQLAAERVTVRFTLKSLFLACDHDGVGVLERERVVNILCNYYDSSADHVKETLQNPREWSIVDAEELQGEVNVNEQKKEDEKAIKTDEVSEETKEENQGEVMKEKDVETGDAKESGNKGEDIIEDELKTDETNQASEDKVMEQDELTEQAEDSQIPPNGEENRPQSERISEDELSETSGSCGRSPSVISDVNCLNQTKFIDLCEQFLGEEPMRSTLESLARFIRASFSETDEERVERQTKARLEARESKRKYMVEQLFDFWDVDRSGTLDFQDIYEVLSKWKDISADARFQKFMEENDTKKEMTCSDLHEYIASICNTCFSDEDPFEAIVIFLHTSIERSFEERKRGEARKEWLNAIDTAAKTSAGTLEPVYRATFKALENDAEAHGHNKVISASVSLLEKNQNPDKLRRGKTVLHYVAATLDDIPFVLNKYLYPDTKTVAFTAVDTGKPIHISKANEHPGVYIWNPAKKQTGVTGSLIVLPLKDHEKRVTGILSVDTLADAHEKSVFITHEISFYQGVAKALSQAMVFVDVLSKTIKIADSAMSWIRRRCLNVQDSVFYVVEPGCHPADGTILRQMFSIDSRGKREYFKDPPRINRKDHLFRDYLFKCVEGLETITSDAYGERHLAFPVLDSNGVAMAVVDLSIGELKVLPSHEMKEIQKMLRLLAMAHKEVAQEVAGHQKNIVLEVERENEDFRIEILFDRLMLTDLRENVARLDARAFAELKSYKDPPKLVHDILKTVLGIFHQNQEEKLENWSTCKGLINTDLVRMITQYDPTATTNTMINAKQLSENLEGIPASTVAKQSSLPAQYLFNWAFVCLSLIEHTTKMNLSQTVKPSTAISSSEESGSLAM